MIFEYTICIWIIQNWPKQYFLRWAFSSEGRERDSIRLDAFVISHHASLVTIYLMRPHVSRASIAVECLVKYSWGICVYRTSQTRVEESISVHFAQGSKTSCRRNILCVHIVYDTEGAVHFQDLEFPRNFHYFDLFAPILFLLVIYMIREWALWADARLFPSGVL